MNGIPLSVADHLNIKELVQLGARESLISELYGIGRTRARKLVRESLAASEPVVQITSGVRCELSFLKKREKVLETVVWLATSSRINYKSNSDQLICDYKFYLLISNAPLNINWFYTVGIWFLNGALVEKHCKATNLRFLYSSVINNDSPFIDEQKEILKGLLLS